MTYYFRPAQITELEAIRKLAEHTFRDTYVEHHPIEVVERYIAHHFQHEMIKEEFLSPDNQFFIVEVRNEIVAYAKLKKGRFKEGKFDLTSLQIERFYVDKSFQNEEIGSRLMIFCKEWAVLNHFVELTLNVWERNEKAIKFYQKMGFQLIGEKRLATGLSEQTEYEMGMSLETEQKKIKKNTQNLSPS